MRRLLILTTGIAILLSACGGAPSQVIAPLVAEPKARNEGAQPALQDQQATATAEPSVTPSPTPTFDIILLFTPQPSETPLPPLELPSPIPNAPVTLAWDGQPTYPGESQPNYFFRVRYNPDVWGLTEDDFGQPALAHRTIEYCVISPTAGRGLPLNVVVEHETRRLGEFIFDINTAYSNGQKQFVTYLGGDGHIYTGFKINFQEDADACIADAESVLATLTSVAESRATPVPTP